MTELNIISLGAGVQSTAMLLMSCRGNLPKADLAIFADTGWEPKAVYTHLDWPKSQSTIPIHIVNNGSLKDDLIKNIEGGSRFASAPFHLINEKGGSGMLRRQCTREYKLQPIYKFIRSNFKVNFKKPCNMWIGISLDEAIRMKPAKPKYAVNTFPLIEKQMRREDCIKWLLRHDYPLPVKSSCIICPYHSNTYWLDTKRNRPEEWQEAVKIDKQIRKLPRIKGEVFLHSQKIPLDKVDLNETQGELFDAECEGMCGV
jgi:hypothetical protein